VGHRGAAALGASVKRRPFQRERRSRNARAASLDLSTGAAGRPPRPRRGSFGTYGAGSVPQAVITTFAACREGSSSHLLMAICIPSIRHDKESAVSELEK
jgi:hypothetical protein